MSLISQNATNRVFALFLAATLAAGCSIFGQTTPQTPEERLIYGYAHSAAALQQADTLLVAKKISSATAECVQTAARAVRTSVRGYLDAEASGKPVNAQAVLVLVSADLAIVLQYADNHGGNLTCQRQPQQ